MSCCVCGQGSQRLQVLVDEWISCKGEWKKSTLYERMMAKKSCRKHGARVWMTKSQIAQKYSDQHIAEQICAAKLEDEATRESQTKAHPDLPDSEAQTGGEVFLRLIAELWHKYSSWIYFKCKLQSHCW